MIVNPGIRRFLGSAIQRLFNSASFYAPLTHTLALERGTGSPTFTRATTATVRDNEGVLRTAISGEARFQGARRVRNLITGSSEDLTNAAWTKDAGVTATFGSTDPLGTTRASKLVMVGAAKRCYNSASGGTTTVYPGFEYFWLKGDVGGEQIQIGDQANLYTVTLTTEWVKYQSTLRNITSGFPQIRSISAGTTTLYATFIQREDVTAQTTQTAGEYVSVGVLSAPYHGSGVDGVKCFPTDISGNPLPTAYTYDAVSLNGLTTTYVSTPATSITGALTIIAKVNLQDYTPATYGVICSNLSGNTGFEFRFDTGSNGILQLIYGNGATLRSLVATSATSVTDATTIYLKVERDRAVGATFSKSTDGTTWTQIGSVVATTDEAMAASSEVVAVGARAGALTGMVGKCYTCSIYSAGTLAVDFDASRYAGGTTLTGSTGETWTLQGNAVIHPTNNPMLGYLAEGARTNLCLQSQDITITWTNIRSTDSANTHVAPDGTTTADSLLEDASVATTRAITQAITFTAATHTFSVWIKGINRTWVKLEIFDGTAIRGAYFQLAAGGAVGTLDAGSTATIEAWSNGWYRCTVTGATAAAAGGVYIFPAEANNDTVYDGNTSNGLAIWGAQVELGSFASSYIPTTTIAVTRNADVLTYSSAGNVSGTVGAAYCEIKTGSFCGRSLSFNAGGTGMIDAGTGDSLSFRAYDETNVVSVTAGDSSASTVRQAIAWGGATLSAARNGTTASGSFDGNMSPTGISIGGTTGGELNGTIRNVRIWQRALSSSELQAVTS